jgi:hypothetical protein
MPLAPYDTEANEAWLGRRANRIGYFGVTAFAARRDATTGAAILVSGSFTTITFDVEEDDTDGSLEGGTWFEHTTGIATIPRDGWYYFGATASVPNIDDAESVRLGAHVNGTLKKDGGRLFCATASASMICTNDFFGKFVLGDTFDFRLVHNEGADQVLTGGSGATYMAGFQVR